MAAIAIAGVQHFIGTAAERAALSTTGITAGSTFYETDTPALYIYGGSAWTEHIVTVQTGDTINIANIGGLAAHDAAASGNPVQIGGVYRVADPAVADGDAASIRVNAKGEALVQLTGRKAKSTYVVADTSTTVAAGANEVITVTPTSGYRARLNAIGLYAPAVGAVGTGSHSFAAYQGTYGSQTILFKVTQSDEKLTIDLRPSEIAVGTLFPSYTDFVNLLNKIVFTAANPLYIRYDNLSNNSNSQTGTKRIRLFLEEEAVI